MKFTASPVRSGHGRRGRAGLPAQPLRPRARRPRHRVIRLCERTVNFDPLALARQRAPCARRRCRPADGVENRSCFKGRSRSRLSGPWRGHIASLAARAPAATTSPALSAGARRRIDLGAGGAPRGSRRRSHRQGSWRQSPPACRWRLTPTAKYAAMTIGIRFAASVTVFFCAGESRWCR